MSFSTEPSQSYYHISVSQSLRVHCSGLELNQAKHVWICLHGYGQLARFFARKFKSLEDKVHFIFPEGMHRFYMQGTEGRVGASWMTKENRLTDIDNQCAYLDEVYTNIPGVDQMKVTLIGFSQGAATASRWMFGSDKQIDHLVLWSGAFPPDLPLLDERTKKSDFKVYQLIGAEDPYLKNQRLQLDTQRDTPPGLDVESILFDGGHEIRPSELQLLADRILS